MNGVMRCGSYRSDDMPYRARIGSRTQLRWTAVYTIVGFRCEWCNKGWLLWWRMGISCN